MRSFNFVRVDTLGKYVTRQAKRVLYKCPMTKWEIPVVTTHECPVRYSNAHGSMLSSSQSYQIASVIILLVLLFHCCAAVYRPQRGSCHLPLWTQRRSQGGHRGPRPPILQTKHKHSYKLHKICQFGQVYFPENN